VETSYLGVHQTGSRPPFTVGVFDQRTQACAVVKKSGVSAKPSEIARKLEHILNSSGIPEKSGFEIKIEVLKDPIDFINQIKSCELVTKFSFSAKFENAHDVHQLIQAPAEKFNEIVQGDKTTVSVQGRSLNKDVVEEVTRAVASVGEEASATIKVPDSPRSKRVSLRGIPLLEAFNSEDDKSSPFKVMLESLRASYGRLRSSKL